MFKDISIGFSRGTSFVSKAIRYFDGGRFNHVYWKLTTRDDIVLIYESHLSGGVQITPYEYLLKAMADGRVTEIRELKLGLVEEALAVWHQCLKLHGDAYDTWAIIRYMIWMGFMQRNHRKSMVLHTDKKFTCNEFIVETGVKTLSCFKGLDYTYTPRRLAEYFLIK